MDLCQVIQANNMAVARLREGRYDEANHTLRRLISVMRNHIQLSSSRSRNMEEDTRSNPSGELTFSLLKDSYLSSSSAEESPPRSNLLSVGMEWNKFSASTSSGALYNTSAVHLYDRALLFFPPGEMEHEDEINGDVLCCTILYNMALAVHLRAMRNDSAWTKAQRLYELVVESTHGFSVSSSNSDEPVLLGWIALAARNNLAYIHAASCRLTQVKATLQDMAGTLAQLQYNNNNIQGELPEEDHVIFHLNALCLQFANQQRNNNPGNQFWDLSPAA